MTVTIPGQMVSPGTPQGACVDDAKGIESLKESATDHQGGTNLEDLFRIPTAQILPSDEHFHQLISEEEEEQAANRHVDHGP